MTTVFIIIIIVITAAAIAMTLGDCGGIF